MEAGTGSGRRRAPGRWAALALVVAFVALLAYGLVAKGTNDEIDSALADGRAPRAPAFDLEVLEAGELPPLLEREIGPAFADGRVSIDELRGTPVVLNMWASSQEKDSGSSQAEPTIIFSCWI